MPTSSTHPLAFLGIQDAAILSVVGYAIVFLGLIALMIVVTLLGKAFVAAGKKKAAAQPAAAPVAEEPAPAAPEAPGTAGCLKLYDTNPKTAAMIMAIVADKMGKPLNELRFISIKEVK